MLLLRRHPAWTLPSLPDRATFAPTDGGHGNQYKKNIHSYSRAGEARGVTTRTHRQAVAQDACLSIRVRPCTPRPPRLNPPTNKSPKLTNANPIPQHLHLQTEHKQIHWNVTINAPKAVKYPQWKTCTDGGANKMTRERESGVVGGMRPPEMHRRRVDHSDAGQDAAAQSGEFIDATPTPLL